MSDRDVLVIGGGVTGIQAALDLGDMGLQVDLVERTPTIGGRMAQLDKTFPTNDCSLCILSPKMAECSWHLNVEVRTYTEVRRIEGTAGDFTVDLCEKSRYVRADRCNGCGDCANACPIEVPNYFEMNLAPRKAVYVPMSQSVPLRYTIDMDVCIHCYKCVDACGRLQAIDFSLEDRLVRENYGAIIVATGFDPFDPSVLTPYGYGQFANVVTALEYERLICASGPTGGHLVRLSDGEPVKRLAFIQCVGGRDVRYNRFCSSVCCMYATKEAILANEHDRDVHSTIFYTDLRAGGKGFQEFVTRAEREYNATYLRGRVAEVSQDENECPVIWYEDTKTGQPVSETVDLAVLAVSLAPRRGAKELAALLDIELDEHDFVKSVPFSLTETTRAGVFACGYCRGPADIPESVAQASGAAARAAEVVVGKQRRCSVPASGGIGKGSALEKWK